MGSRFDPVATPGRRDMRAVAAIIVAVMSVTTGGPFRCPCQLAALFKERACNTEATRPAPPVSEKHGCSCKHHSETERPAPSEPKPAPGVPCEHGPKIDLVPPFAGGDRDLDDSVFADPGRSHALPLTPVPPATSPDTPAPLSSPSDRLRYCHAFRC